MDKNLFVIAGTEVGKLNAMVKNVMCQMNTTDPNEAIRRINSGEWIVSQVARAWREQDGVIYFSVTSDGTTGEEWIKRLEKKRFRIGDYAKNILRSKDFKPTSGVTTEIAVLKGMLFVDSERITKNIHVEADKRKFEKPNAEVACLIREKFTNEEIESMGLMWIVTMHEPIKTSDGNPNLLGAFRSDDGQWLDNDWGHPDGRWLRGSGFAFVVQQVST